jgi:hypothetical protein
MLEDRGNGRTYRYTYKKQNGVSRRIYSASGELARIEAEIEAAERAERESMVAAEREELARLGEELEASARLVGEASRAAEAVVAAEMARYGIRRVGSRWRRKRGEPMGSVARTRPANGIPAVDRTVSKLDNLRLLTAIESMGFPDEFEVKEELRRDMVALAREIAGPSPSASEWAQSLTLAIIGMELLAHEGRVALLDRKGEQAGKQFARAARHVESLRRQQSRALRDLAAIRRYQAVVAVQIAQLNVAGQQVVQNAPPPAAEPAPAKAIDARPATRGRRAGGWPDARPNR